jgi:hypothetical protein
MDLDILSRVVSVAETSVGVCSENTAQMNAASPDWRKKQRRTFQQHFKLDEETSTNWLYKEQF